MRFRRHTDPTDQIRLQEMIPRNVAVEPNSLLRELGLDKRMKWEGDQMVIPANMTPQDAVDQISAAAARMSEIGDTTEFEFFIDYPRDDVYISAFRVLQREFDLVLMAPPSPFERGGTHYIDLGNGDSTSIELGSRILPDLANARVSVCGRHLHVVARREYREVFETLADLIRDDIEANSIYRGKAITANFTFVDLTGFDPADIVYNSRTARDLRAFLWMYVTDSDRLIADGHPLKRAVLLHGDYGTGKTLTALKTALLCTANGWTFINAKPGECSLYSAMDLGKQFGPALVFFEDIDKMLTDDPGELSQLLEAFDGLDTKGHPLIVVMTTNHADKIPKGMYRPGRIDAAIELLPLDAEALHQLAINVLGGAEALVTDIDWGEIANAFAGMTPSFASEAFRRSTLYQMAEGGEGPITQQMLVDAGTSLNEQRRLMDDAPEMAPASEVGTAMERLVGDVLTTHRVDDMSGALVPASFNGHR